jgi:phage terminase large subunit-like protein
VICLCGSSASEHFCEPRADRVQAFIERICKHTKGRFARSPFILADWQRDEIVRPLFGNVRYDSALEAWVRTYRIAWIELARKNGKSELLAAIALYMLVADDEAGGEIYGCAKDRDQASLVYDVARRMVEMSPVLSKRLEIRAAGKRIIDPKTGSVYQVIAADAAGNLGQNPHAVIFDEVLTQPSRDLWDAMRTGMGARTQPLMVAATTAGTVSTFAHEESQWSQQVVADPAKDPTRFVFMRNTALETDWRDESTWIWANPALGDFLSLQTLRDEAHEAEQRPAAQNSFRQFRLNQWTQQSTRWLDLGLWDENASIVDRETLKGLPAYGGLDMASTADFTAWVLLVPKDDALYVVPRFWLPRGALAKAGVMRGTYELWVKQGFLTLTDGDVVSHRDIVQDIGKDAEHFDIREFAFDPWQSDAVVQQLEDGGLLAVKCPQNMGRLSPPSKELERLLGERRFHHGGNPILRWMADNVEAERDAADNIKPSKKKSAEKIDGIVAAVMAISSWSANQRAKPKSKFQVYFFDQDTA